MPDLHILGCDGGIGGERRTMCLRLGDTALIDCGSGAGDLSLDEMARIEHVFLTHAHLDHIALLPMLIDAAAARRNGPVSVHGLPETLVTLQECLFNGRLWPDYGRLPSPQTPYLRYVPLHLGETRQLGDCRVTTLPAHHAVAAVGYRLEGASGSFAYSGDTTLHEPFWRELERLPGLRYLMVECTFLSANSAGAVRSGHLTPALLAAGLSLLKQPLEVLIAHLESGQEEASWEEITRHCGRWQPRRVKRGEVFRF